VISLYQHAHVKEVLLNILDAKRSKALMQRILFIDDDPAVLKVNYIFLIIT
jgi:hypothetical protein